MRACGVFQARFANARGTFRVFQVQFEKVICAFGIFQQPLSCEKGTYETPKVGDADAQGTCETPKVGGHSLASRMPSRPLVPAPT